MMNHPSPTSAHPGDNHNNRQPDHTKVQIAPEPVSPPPMPSEPNLPFDDLFLEDRREDYMKFGVPLYEAAIKGDWKAAKPILEKRRELVRFAITESSETPLHVAASAESTKAVEKFIINLLNMMEEKDLELQNDNYNTALSLAAKAGNIGTAKLLVEKNSSLIEIPGSNYGMPLYMAALFAKPHMVRYLHSISNSMTGRYWHDKNRGWVLLKCVEAEIFDVAIQIVREHRKLMDDKTLVTDVLLALARNTQAFETARPVLSILLFKKENESGGLQLLREILKIIAKMPKSEIDDILQGHARSTIPTSKTEKILQGAEGNTMMRTGEIDNIHQAPEAEGDTTPKSEIGNTLQGPEGNAIITRYPSRVLFVATKNGNTKFIVELIHSYPDLIWKQDDKGRTIFHLAIMRRHAEIYNLLYEIGAMKDFITTVVDIHGNNMLHMVAKKAKKNNFQNVSRVALEMQQELLWFEEVKQMIPPTYRQKKNEDGKTPQHLFGRKQAKLVSKGEEWMNNYMLVATLIATIVFAAAFTLPGGYNQGEGGIPFFHQKPSLIIFVISDAVSLITSSTSVLIFLSILTSRHAQHDFIKLLPIQLIVGLTTLFLSIVTMMVAFSASFFVLYDKKLKWMPIMVTSLAGIPVLLFALLQFNFLKNVLFVTYRSRYLFNPKKRILYC